MPLTTTAAPPQGAEDVWTRDVLNLGVSPDKLIAKVAQRFTSLGGAVLDNTAVQGISVHPDGVVAELASGGGAMAQLLVDCMGHASAIVRQIRYGLWRPARAQVHAHCAERALRVQARPEARRRVPGGRHAVARLPS